MAKFSGSCICGSISYTITGEPHKFFHCYCMRCRKSSGTGHASNILLKPNTVTWEEGEHYYPALRCLMLKDFALYFVLSAVAQCRGLHPIWVSPWFLLARWIANCHCPQLTGFFIPQKPTGHAPLTIFQLGRSTLNSTKYCKLPIVAYIKPQYATKHM